MPSDRSNPRSSPKSRGIRAKLEKARAALEVLSPGDPIVAVRAVDDARVRVSVESRNPSGRSKRSGFVMSIDAAHRLGLRVGANWTSEAAEGVIESIAREEAMRAAMSTAGRSSVSRRRLIDKLCQKGHDRALATEAAARMVELGLVNDEAAADAAAKTIARRTPSGRALIESKLRGAGFEGTVARAAAEQAASERDARADALALARKKVRVLPRGLEPMARRRRVEGALARRGFDPDTCRWAAKQALGAESEEE